MSTTTSEKRTETTELRRNPDDAGVVPQRGTAGHTVNTCGSGSSGFLTRTRTTTRARVSLRRPADRRPRGVRPRSASLAYGSDRAVMSSISAAARPPAGYPQERVAQAQLGLAALAVSAALTALVVIALLGIAHLRAEPVRPGGPADAPSVVQTVDVDGRGADFPR